MIKSRGLNHIHLNVGNLKRSVKFYEEAFGLNAVLPGAITPAL